MRGILKQTYREKRVSKQEEITEKALFFPVFFSKLYRKGID